MYTALHTNWGIPQFVSKLKIALSSFYDFNLTCRSTTWFESSICCFKKHRIGCVQSEKRLFVFILTFQRNAFYSCSRNTVKSVKSNIPESVSTLSSSSDNNQTVLVVCFLKMRLGQAATWQQRSNSKQVCSHFLFFSPSPLTRCLLPRLVQCFLSLR